MTTTIDKTDKVVYAPFQTTNKKGKEKTAFIRLGVRIHRGNEVWFYCFKHDSWTRKQPGRPVTNRAGSVVYERGVIVMTPERKFPSMKGDKGLQEKYGHCPQLVEFLLNARTLAEAEDAAKRAA